MTKPHPYRPEPTAGTPYDVFVWPRSKTPARQAIYDWLLDNGWRYDAHYALWFTPEGQPESSGSLECAPDYTWWRIQPPSVNNQRATPLIEKGGLVP